MTPYTDEWNKWRAGRRSKLLIDRSRARVAKQNKRLAGEPFVPRQGDNFRFVRWGGLADLSLWNKREG
jgi:hypothetical protein